MGKVLAMESKDQKATEPKDQKATEAKGQKENVRGRVFYIEQKEDSYIVKIIFKYSYENLRDVQEGAYVSVRSFESFLRTNHEQGLGKDTQIQSILMITNVLPVHSSIESLRVSEKSIPTIEYLENIANDLDIQNPPQSLIILADAVPTVYSFYIKNGKPVFFKSNSKPVIASPVEILDKNIVENFINPETKSGVVNAGKIYIPSLYTEQKSYVNDPNVPDLRLHVDKLVSRHYGIYGANDSGKTNLSAHIISEIARLGKIEDSEIKIIIFDHSNEYLPLLADLSDEITYISAEDKDQIIERLKFPLRIEDDKSLVKALKKLISDKVDFTKEKFFENIPYDLQEICTEAIYSDRRDEDDIIEEAKETIISYIENYSSIRKLPSDSAKVYMEYIKQRLDNTIKWLRSSNSDYGEERIDKLEEEMLSILDKPFIDGLVYWANNYESTPNYRRIVIVHHDYLLPYFVADFISTLLRGRRDGWGEDTYVLIVIDEAPEYAPLRSHSFADIFIERLRRYYYPSEEGTDYTSFQIERLARVGKSYKIGLCLSSQRLEYLSASVRKNLGTAFVGPLLQAGDKDAIFEAANISPEHLRVVNSFQPGQWLVSSSSGALGRTNVPVKVIAYNRENRIIDFVNLFRMGKILSKSR